MISTAHPVSVGFDGALQGAGGVASSWPVVESLNLPRKLSMTWIVFSFRPLSSHSRLSTFSSSFFTPSIPINWTHPCHHLDFRSHVTVLSVDGHCVADRASIPRPKVSGRGHLRQCIRTWRVASPLQALHNGVVAFPASWQSYEAPCSHHPPPPPRQSDPHYPLAHHRRHHQYSLRILSPLHLDGHTMGSPGASFEDHRGQPTLEEAKTGRGRVRHGRGRWRTHGS